MAVENNISCSVAEKQNSGSNGLKHCVFISFLVLILSPISSEAVFELRNNMEGLHLTREVIVLEDKGKSLTIDDIRSPEYSSRFTSPPSGKTNFGLSSSAWWLKFHIVNPTNRSISWYLHLLHPQFHFSDLYYFPSKGAPLAYKQGLQVPSEDNPVNAMGDVFALNTKAGESGTAYLRVGFRTVGFVETMLQAWSPRLFEISNARQLMVYSFIIGGTLMLALYNLFLAFSFRTPEYFWYVLCISCNIISLLASSGIGARFFWGTSYFGEIIYPVSMMICMCFAIQFTRDFLNTKSFVPLIDKFFRLVIILNAILFVFVVNGSRKLAIICAMSDVFVIFTLPLIGMWIWNQGKKEATFFITAWLLWDAGALIVLLRVTGVLPPDTFTLFAPRIGFLGEAVFLSLALVDRINILKEEKKTAEKKMRAVLERSRGELELKVEERTQELETAKNEAENATKLKDQFISLVSHDLRSPLSGMLGVLNLLRNFEKHKINDLKARERIEIVHGSAKSLYEFVKKLLDVNRLQSGHIQPYMELINTEILINRVLIRIMPMVSQKEIRVSCMITKDHTLFADPELLGEALSNILSNAVKFCSKGDTITIFAPENKAGGIAVRDSGPGVRESFLPNLFKHEIKTTGIGSMSEKGTGLGLPHSADIVRAHNGEITVESVAGKGATFTIVLPNPEKFVLIADDQAAHRAMMKEHILKISHNGNVGITEADNGRMALSFLNRFKPDVIITDINMPEVDGVELIRAIRAQERFNDTPIIAASSFDWLAESVHDEKRSEVMELGATDFVAKPIQSGVFEELIQSYLK